MKNVCKYFDENKMAAYIEKRMSPEEIKKYEKHLFKCNYCLKVYFNLEKEILKLKKSKAQSIPEKLLKEGLDKLMKIKCKKITLPDFSKVAIKLYKKGMELIEVANVKTLTPVLVTPVRGKVESSLLKQLVIESDIYGVFYKLFIDFYAQNRIKIRVNFLQFGDDLKHKTIELVSEEGKIVRSLTNEAIFDDLKKGIYKIKLNGIVLLKLNFI